MKTFVLTIALTTAFVSGSDNCSAVKDRLSAACTNYNRDAFIENFKSLTFSQIGKGFCDSECSTEAKSIYKNPAEAKCLLKAKQGDDFTGPFAKFQFYTAPQVLCKQHKQKYCVDEVEKVARLLVNNAKECVDKDNETTCEVETTCEWRNVTEDTNIMDNIMDALNAVPQTRRFDVSGLLGGLSGLSDLVKGKEKSVGLCLPTVPRVLDDGICKNGCFDGVLQLWKRVLSFRDLDLDVTVKEQIHHVFSTLRRRKQLMCSNIGQTPCYNKVMKWFDGENADGWKLLSLNLDTAAMNTVQKAICETREMRQCTKKVLSTLEKVKKEDYISMSKNVSTNNAEKNAAMKIRKTYLKHELKRLAKRRNGVASMCKTNGEKKPQYCLSLLHEIRTTNTDTVTETCRSGLFDVELSAANCSGNNCDTWASSLVNRFGCCVHKINHLSHQHAPVEYDDIPSDLVPDAANLTDEEKNFVKNHLLKPIETCSSFQTTEAKANLTKQCHFKKITRGMKFNWKWAKVKVMPNFDAFQLRLVKRTCEAVGAEDCTGQLGPSKDNVKASRRRAAGESATELQLDIGGDDQTEANDAALTLDALLADGGLAKELEEEIDTLKDDCAECVVGEGTIEAADEGTTGGGDDDDDNKNNTEGEPNSSGAGGHLIACIVNVVVLLLLVA